MVKKIFVYRGKSLEELQSLSLKELAEYLPARQRRKIERGFTAQEKILIENMKTSKKTVETHCRDTIVLPEMIGKSIKIHSGKEFVQIMLIPEMIGHYFGEFVMTRKKVAHNAPGIGATKSSSSVSVR